jgi:hypothetical protein
MNQEEREELFHYGTPRHSGRYPWGSGHDPQQHQRDFLGEVERLKGQGLTETQIAAGFDITTTQLRAARAIARNATRASDVSQALRLKDKGLSTSAIGRAMGRSESAVRSLLDPAIADRQNVLETVAGLLKEKVGNGYLDIGSGTENHLGISSTKLATAVEILKAQHGYVTLNVQVPQVGTHNKTTIKVLGPPGTTYAEVKRNQDKIKSVAAYSEDNSHTIEEIHPPRSISSSRVAVRYAEDGGSKADGVIYVRPGVHDVTLGSARYAQVRVAVDGTHYLKGMAVYKDDLPKGVDLEFNTNKHDTGNKLDAMKKIKGDDEEHPFGAVTRQKTYIDAHGNKQLSVMNIVNEEGDWRDWSRTLSSQFLSKQSPALARRQLDLAYHSRRDELDEIMRLTNPVVKKNLLGKFADGADSASVQLKAAALPRQGNHVILPVQSLKENEVYAPNYRNGEKVVLVRFPHAGTFELPQLTVNNRNREAQNLIGTVRDGSHQRPIPDAVGIHPKVAERLSGADFDGDHVIVIPNNTGVVKTTAPLAGLKNFDPHNQYAKYEGMAVITPRAKQQQMGDVSNLITDMTVKGARPEELAAAVRHSMVVIDAEKHELNYRQSYIDNGIASLKKKYQGTGSTGRLSGAATIVSRSGNATVRVPERKLRRAAQGGPVDAATGRKVYVPTGETYVRRTAVNLETGKRETVKKGMKYDPSTVKETTITRTMDSRPLLETEDAHTLVSKDGGTPIEHIYADQSNRLRALANEARKASLTTPNLVHSPTAAKTYAHEVSELNRDLRLAIAKRPLERQAQLLANSIISAKLRDSPGMDAADLKKEKGRALQTARARLGSKKTLIDITPRQWEAIQAGAISSKRLSDILDNANTDKVKALATPRTATVVTPARLSRAKLLLDAGYSQAEVADQLGIPVSTLNSALAKEGVGSG